MLPIATIQFTQEQARALTGVSVETIRHWRKTVPYLAGKSGKSARFTFGDVVGLAVTGELIDLGMRIANVSAGIETLFQLLDQAPPSILQAGIVLVTKTGASIVRSEESIGLRIDLSGLVVSLEPLIIRIREHMLPISPALEQVLLPFPPQVARSGV